MGRDVNDYIKIPRGLMEKIVEKCSQANILYDYSVTDYIHVESTVSLATEGILRLAETAGLELKGNIFRM